jgi:hypothetical protein
MRHQRQRLALQELLLQFRNTWWRVQAMRLSQARPAPARCQQHGHPSVVVGLAHEPTGPAAVAAVQDY